jgi:protoheme ferro-lyase
MLNESSSEEEIISYIEKDSFGFLCSFHHKTWAQPYLDKAVKLAAEVDNYDFLFIFHDNPWAQPHLDKAAKSATEEFPISFLRHFHDKPWAQPYLKTAAEKLAKINPEYYMERLAQDYPEYIVTAAYSLRGKDAE